MTKKNLFDKYVVHFLVIISALAGIYNSYCAYTKDGDAALSTGYILTILLTILVYVLFLFKRAASQKWGIIIFTYGFIATFIPYYFNLNQIVAYILLIPYVIGILYIFSLAFKEAAKKNKR